MPGEVAGRVVGALGGLLLLHGPTGREIRINPRNVKRLTYYNTRKTNAELQSLTT